MSMGDSKLRIARRDLAPICGLGVLGAVYVVQRDRM
jgi:hypothetical protein